ncbi:MAG: cupin domain-containing protein [Candidatus Zhuqueibacterota bacterium]
MRKIPDSVPVNLGKLVEYAPHSVVSMEIVKNNSGTLTIFAFDAGQGLSEHSTPFDAVVQTLDGEAEWTIGDKQAIVRAGEMVLLPANVPHAVAARTPFKMLLIMIRG